MKLKGIIFDLDGTLCNADHRRHHVEGDYKKKDFETFYEKMHLDTPNMWCANMVKLYYKAGYQIYFCTGRPEEYREKTTMWLFDHLKLLEGEYKLLMRHTGNYTDDRLVKVTMYTTVIEPECDVELVIDDRSKVVKIWRELGLTCLQCYPGDF